MWVVGRVKGERVVQGGSSDGESLTILLKSSRIQEFKKALNKRSCGFGVKVKGLAGGVRFFSFLLSFLVVLG